MAAEVDKRSDAELMASLRVGEMEALGALYLRYGAFVSHAIISAAPTLSREEVEDICHDTFLTVRKKASGYREDGKLKAWLYSIAYRSARGRRRQFAIRNRLLRPFAGKPLAMSSMVRPSPEVGAMLHLDMERLLSSLSESERQILFLYEKEGLSGEEISEMLDMNINTVWTKMRRARVRLMAEVKAMEGPADRGGRR